MDKSALTSRWARMDGTRLRAIGAWLLQGGDRPEGLAESEGGRIDLRGLPLVGPLPLAGSPDELLGPTWESLDLRGARLDDLRLFGVSIRDCLFDGASCVGWRLWGVTVKDCSFDRADLTGSALGSGEWPGGSTSWSGVSFGRAKLENVRFGDASILECTFGGMRKVLFDDCEIVDSAFSGKMNSVIIDGRKGGPRLAADFGEATFVDSQIIGYRLNDSKLPRQADLRLIESYPAVVRAALALLGSPVGGVDARAASVLTWLSKAPGGEYSDWCFDIAAFGSGGDDALPLRLDDLFARVMAESRD